MGATDHLAKQLAELALRVAALPANVAARDTQVLDAIEEAASRVLREIAAIRANTNRPVGETSGMWRVVQPLPRQ